MWLVTRSLEKFMIQVFFQWCSVTKHTEMTINHNMEQFTAESHNRHIILRPKCCEISFVPALLLLQPSSVFSFFTVHTLLVFFLFLNQSRWSGLCHHACSVQGPIPLSFSISSSLSLPVAVPPSSPICLYPSLPSSQSLFPLSPTSSGSQILWFI